MQRVSLALNVILLIAITWLFVKVNNISSKIEASTNDGRTIKDSTVKIPDDGQMRIAFIMNDSLSEYELYKVLMKELADEENKAKATYSAELKKAQKREKEIKDRHPFIPMSEQEAGQKELMELERKLMQLEQTLYAPLQEKQAKYTKQIYDNITSYVSEYAAENRLDYVLSYAPGSGLVFANPAFDITTDIVSGLNEQYKKFNKDESKSK